MAFRGVFLVFVFLAALSGPAAADETAVSEADRSQIRSIIERQIAAFRQG